MSSNGMRHISVMDFYKGKSIFLTGATGFLGKLVAEKILWSCPEIENIFLLIRPKKNEDERTRLLAVLGTHIFDRIRQHRPNDLKKIIPISGDLSQPYLSISQTDKETLIRRVSVVFHIAATVRFDEPLKQSVIINTTATKHLAEFCLQMPNIKAFVYVSTAFSNCDRDVVEEKIYKAPHDPESIIRLVEIMDDEFFEKLTPQLLGERPNTYVYTKALAENILEKYQNELPIAVVRPSIVLSSIRDPLPGWIDSWNGPSPFIAAGGRGILHGVLGDARKVADVIPADIVVNLTICAGWRTAIQPEKTNIEVYNCCSGERNPISWGDFMRYCYVAAIKNPSEEIVKYPFISLQRHRSTRFIQMFLMERIPSFIIDLVHYLGGKKAIMLNIHGKLLRLNDSISFVTLRQWRFTDKNTQNLLNLLNDEDRQTFLCDVHHIHWPTFLETYYQGIRHYLLKENPNSMEASRKRLEKLKWMNIYVPCLIFITAILYLIYIF